MAERSGKIKEVKLNLHSTQHENGYSRLLIGTELVYVALVNQISDHTGNVLDLIGRVVRYDTFDEVTGVGTFTVLIYIIFD